MAASQVDEPDGGESGGGSFMRKPMTKKELQAFMKAKLAKTKVNDQVTTQQASTGPTAKNFTMKVRQSEPTQRKDFQGAGAKKPPAPKRPPANATPSTYKGKGPTAVQEDSDDS